MARSVRKAVRLIARVQSDRGDEGCYAEVHGTLRSAVQKIGLMSSFIGRQETGIRLGKISRLVKSLPNLHSEKVVNRVYKEVDHLTRYK